jgi:hypothetical protein
MLTLSLENRRDRYSLKEKLKIYALLKRRGAEERAEEVAPLVTSKGSFLAQVKQVIVLPSSLQQCVEEGIIDVKTARTVSDLPPEAVHIYLETIMEKNDVRKQEGLPLSLSLRRLLLHYLYEVVKREGMEKRKILETFSTVLSHMPLQEAFEKARRMRYPELSKREDALRRFENEKIRGTGIKVEAPPNFEGDSYKFNFSVNSPAQIDTMISRLRLIRNNSDELFRLL